MRKADKELAQKLLTEIRLLAQKINRPLRLMEVCGTHTVAIFRGGLRQILPKGLELVSGPGCPVCVTDDSYMDKAIAYARRDDVIITTFGDMLKVPGSESSLGAAKTEGADVRIVYSPMDSLKIAAENTAKKIVFLAVGFETTAPTAAATVIAAKKMGLRNMYFLSAQKLVPPALKFLLADPEVKVDGFILPGHVAVVTGRSAFDFLARDYKMPGVVSGFEPVEILTAIYHLLRQIAAGEPRVENDYKSVVKEKGNEKSREMTQEVYEKVDALWRGIGSIEKSGLKMRETYADYDIEKILPININTTPKKTACRCGEVLRGIIKPTECPLFNKACTPTHAVGPCMVSVEGVCAAWQKYGQGVFHFGEGEGK